ncbi:response regulator [Pseudodesulfovibrio portus]|jgi:DNA-binding NtrC family response regulator|uniref:Response regulator n=1 Tax=Pseudodesulfovibrio portus TaxID=231439 RepID=A0ABN6RV32_9BACT|nr:response regulator [Pseudodesulfovibrio portus]BDQ34959.1 response regulator [Pseudodesulfovibrio portus]
MPANILLVDDEQGFVETLAKRVANRGLTVHTAMSGQEAIDFLAGNHSVDVVVMDVKMPGIDGTEALKLIKNAHPLVEVIMLTGHATVESAIEGMKSGAFDYLMKPAELEDLLAKVNEAYDKKQTHETKILEARARHIVLRRGD